MGKANNLKSRVSSYFTQSYLEPKTKQLVSKIAFIHITPVDSELEALLLEVFYIKSYKPKYNLRLTDNKSYPLIRITNKEEMPSITLARRIEDPKSLYFGPFPSSSSVKMVLKVIRRIFPYHSMLNHPKRICLYHHLGLCPCLPVNNTIDARKEYKKNIKRIIQILEGESKQLQKELEKERDMASKDERFEDALTLQKQVSALSYITQPFRRPVEYHVNPNLREDIRHSEMEELQQVLQQAGYRDMPLPRKIECFDISHIQGKLTVASMTVVIDGEKETNLYRKFRIQHEKTPDDFMSMREVLTRRLKHTEWEYPDLLIVDGGKGQVSSALEVFLEKGIEIPLIGLAKREETIVVPLSHPLIQTGDKKKDPFLEVLLPHSSKSLHLIQRIRDEAHRFAITYHRLLRSKQLVGKDK